jgi:type VI secretion system secreted protein Hcp
MAVDMFLKLDGVDGESVDVKYQKWIEVLSFSWGISDGSKATNPPGKSPNAKRAQVSDLSITKYLDTSSPKLFEKCCEGEHIGGATLVMRKAGDKPLEFYKIKLQDVLISSVQNGGAGGGIATEFVSFSFASSQISSADEKGSFSTVSSCGAASFDTLDKR